MFTIESWWTHSCSHYSFKSYITI
uniref:Uncharacterized protein n=1 Tax=Megaselia scalaris TaxID=36166 RepID=T1GNY5_MEGSC